MAEGQRLDVSAKPFVPQWLRQQTEQPEGQTSHSTCTAPGPPPPDVNFPEFTLTFMPKPLAENCPSYAFLQSMYSGRYSVRSNSGQPVPLKQLTKANYYRHFYNALTEE